MAGWTRARRREARRDKLKSRWVYPPKKWGRRRRRRAARPAPRGAIRLFLAELLRSYPTTRQPNNDGGKTTTNASDTDTHSATFPAVSPVRALLRLSLVWGRAQGEAIHSKRLPNTGTGTTVALRGRRRRRRGAEFGEDASPRTDTNRRRPLTRKNSRRQRAGAFQVGSSLAEDVAGLTTVAWAAQLRTGALVRVESEGKLKMAAALFSEMSHPHGDPNTGAPARLPSHARLQAAGPGGCALASTGIKSDPSLKSAKAEAG